MTVYKAHIDTFSGSTNIWGLLIDCQQPSMKASATMDDLKKAIKQVSDYRNSKSTDEKTARQPKSKADNDKIIGDVDFQVKTQTICD